MRGKLREVVLFGAAVQHCRQAWNGCRVEVGDETMVADGKRDLGDIGDGAQLSRAQQRHRRHRDPACFEDAEPCRDQPRVVGATQQHTVSRHQARLLDQHSSDLV